MDIESPEAGVGGDIHMLIPDGGGEWQGAPSSTALALAAAGGGGTAGEWLQDCYKEMAATRGQRYHSAS